MPVVPADNRLFADIDRTYIIHVAEYKGTETIAMAGGKSKKVNSYYPKQIVSARTLKRYIEDEESRIRLFNDVLEAGQDKYPRLIRNRLKIEFTSK